MKDLAGDRDALSVVRVPTVEEEDRRRLLRERDAVVQQRTGCSNRIVGLLRAQGVRDLHPRNRGFLTKLGRVRTGDGREIPPCLYSQYCGLQEWIDVLERKKKTLQRKSGAMVGNRTSIRIGSRHRILPRRGYRAGNLPRARKIPTGSWRARSTH